MEIACSVEDLLEKYNVDCKILCESLHFTQDRIAWIRSDCRLDRTPDQIGSDWYFRFWCRRIILTKVFFDNNTGDSEQEIRVLTTARSLTHD